MKPLYQSRIMALIDGCLFEIARFRRCPTLADVRGITNDLSAKWWMEKTLGRQDTITSRWIPPASAEAHRVRAGHARKFRMTK